MSDWYYYTTSGEMIGPLSPAVVRALAKQGIITRETVLENSEGQTFVAGNMKGLVFPEAPPAVAPPPFIAPPPVYVHPSSGPGDPTRKNYKVTVIALLVVIFFLSAYIFRDSISTMAPELGESMTGYRRGFGDTILTYKNRSYEGTKWKEVSLSQSEDSDSKYCRMAGWEDKDYWIVTENVNIFHCKNGSWTHPYRQNGRSYGDGCAILFDKNRLLASWVQRGDEGRTRLFREDGTNVQLPDTYYNVLYVDNGLLYVWEPREWGTPDIVKKISFTNIDTLGDNSTKYEKITREDKAYFVHTTDNIATSAPINNLSNFIQVAPGKCVASAGNILVEFRNGTWYKIKDLPNNHYSSMWLDCVGATPKHAVLVCDNGQVVIHSFGESYREMQVPQSQETTSMKLFRVWGNNINKFWTMDTNGTIWEKKENDWRIVVRGLRKNDVHFIGAWVSPTGTIYAITETKLYQLK